MPTTTTPPSIPEPDVLVSLTAVYEAAYARGVRDALDQLAEMARDSRAPRGRAAVAEARTRLLGIDVLSKSRGVV
jgi:hypothetical protein